MSSRLRPFFSLRTSESTARLCLGGTECGVCGKGERDTGMWGAAICDIGQPQRVARCCTRARGLGPSEVRPGSSHAAAVTQPHSATAAFQEPHGSRASSSYWNVSLNACRQCTGPRAALRRATSAAIPQHGRHDVSLWHAGCPERLDRPLLASRLQRECCKCHHEHALPGQQRCGCEDLHGPGAAVGQHRLHERERAR